MHRSDLGHIKLVMVRKGREKGVSKTRDKADSGEESMLGRLFGQPQVEAKA
jgi:hypothetical protein